MFFAAVASYITGTQNQRPRASTALSVEKEAEHQTIFSANRLSNPYSFVRFFIKRFSFLIFFVWLYEHMQVYKPNSKATVSQAAVALLF